MGKSYQLLEWDSSFFGFDVYSINSNNETTIKDQLHQLKKHDGSLVYLFTDLVFDDVFLTKSSGKFVGTKVVFSKNLQSVSSNNIIKSHFLYNSSNDSLANLVSILNRENSPL